MMNRTVFKIQKMDCPCEENLIRMKLQSYTSVKSMDFDLANRKLSIIHTGAVEPVEAGIASLNLGSSVICSEPVGEPELETDNNKQQRKILGIVLLVNFLFFIVEMTTGLLSRSMGLVADSLDMLADAFVYGLSLFVVGATVLRKKRVALISGYFQILLAASGFAEVIKRFVGMEEIPDFRTMLLVSVLALGANVFCLLLLQRTKSKEAHIQASIIFSSNDIIINAGVIVAGVIVWLSGSGLPDLIIGSIIFVIVIRGALRILKLAK